MTRSRAFTSRWTNHLGSTVNTVQCKSLRRLLRLSCPFRLKFELWVSDDLLKQRLKLRAYAYSMMKGQCSIIKPSALFLYTWLVHIRPTTYKICMTNIPDPRNSWIWTIYARYTRTNEHSYWHTGHHVILLLHSKQHIWCPHGITTESIWFEQQKHRIHSLFGVVPGLSSLFKLIADFISKFVSIVGGILELIAVAGLALLPVFWMLRVSLRVCWFSVSMGRILRTESRLSSKVSIGRSFSLCNSIRFSTTKYLAISTLLFDNAIFNKLLDLEVRTGVWQSFLALFPPLPILIDSNGQQFPSINHFSSERLLPRTAQKLPPLCKQMES